MKTRFLIIIVCIGLVGVAAIPYSYASCAPTVMPEPCFDSFQVSPEPLTEELIMDAIYRNLETNYDGWIQTDRIWANNDVGYEHPTIICTAFDWKGQTHYRMLQWKDDYRISSLEDYRDDSMCYKWFPPKSLDAQNPSFDCKEAVKNELPTDWKYNCYDEPLGNPLRDISLSNYDDPQRLEFILDHCAQHGPLDYVGQLRYLNDTHLIDLDTCKWDIRSNSGVSLDRTVYSMSESSNCQTICILESSWDGTEYVNPGETYWLKTKINPDEKLHVKIFYYDKTIVHEKIYEPDENSEILIEYPSPDNEDSLSYYRVDMHIDNSPDIRAGSIFRIGDTYNAGLFPIQSIPYTGEAKIGDTIHMRADNNNRWSMPMTPNHFFNATLYDPSGNMVYHNTISTDEFGDFDDSFRITEPGFYKLIFKDDNSQQVIFFPKNFDVVKTISAEGKDFDFKFGFEDNGIMFNVDDMIFDQQGKSLKILADNPTNDYVRFELSIPHEFLNGNMTTLMNGELRTDFDQRHVLGHSITVFNLPPGAHTVEITGTSAIPEFQTVAILVLLFSLLPVILLRKQLVLK